MWGRFTALLVLISLGAGGPALADGGPVAAIDPDLSTPPDAVLLPPPAAAFAPTSAADAIIASMVAQVSEDSLYAFLAKLTGDVPVNLAHGPVWLRTRYAHSIGQEYAGEFLAETFESFGWNVERHYFSFPINLAAIHATPAGIGLVVGGKGRILRTEDLGTWERMRDGLGTHDGTLRDLDDVSGDDFVAVGDAGFIATSADAGLGWTIRTSPITKRLNGVSVLPSGVGWIAANGGKILRTTDGGQSWLGQPNGTSAELHGVAALGDTEAVVVGDGGVILRTVDGGSNWTPVSSGVSQDLKAVAFADDFGWAVGSSGTILRSTNRGVTWGTQIGGTTNELNGVAFADASTGWAVGEWSIILHTTDSGVTWSPQISPAANLVLKDVHALSASDAWIAGVSGTILRTTNGGTDWTTPPEPVQDGWANIIGVLPGRTTPAEEVLLICHYDSISRNSDPMVLAPGADDNGSGTATIVEAARLLGQARYDRTIKIACFAAEELGLLGSGAYATRAAAKGQQIVGVFNFDMVGWNDDYIRIFSDDDSQWLGDIAYSMATTYAPSQVFQHYWCNYCGASDHRSFWDHGYDSIFGSESWVPAPPNYHTRGDTLGTLSMPLLANTARVALATAATVAGVDTTAIVSAPLALGGSGAIRLSPGYPNPSSGETIFRYEIPHAARVNLAVYDVAGRLVRELVNAPLPAGAYTATWSGTDGGGKQAAAGVYFYRLKAGSVQKTKSLAVIR